MARRVSLLWSKLHWVQNLNKIHKYLHFLLVPDAGAARRLRRLLCSDQARVGVLVGTWGELLEQARAAYLLPVPDEQWGARFSEALAANSKAFWARSYKVAAS